MERLPEFSVPYLIEIPRHVTLDIKATNTYWGEIYIFYIFKFIYTWSW